MAENIENFNRYYRWTMNLCITKSNSGMYWKKKIEMKYTQEFKENITIRAITVTNVKKSLKYWKQKKFFVGNWLDDRIRYDKEDNWCEKFLEILNHYLRHTISRKYYWYKKGQLEMKKLHRSQVTWCKIFENSLF